MNLLLKFKINILLNCSRFDKNSQNLRNFLVPEKQKADCVICLSITELPEKLSSRPTDN